MSRPDTITIPRDTALALKKFLDTKREAALFALAPSEAASFHAWAKFLDNKLYGDGTATGPIT